MSSTIICCFICIDIFTTFIIKLLSHSKISYLELFSCKGQKYYCFYLLNIFPILFLNMIFLFFFFFLFLYFYHSQLLSLVILALELINHLQQFVLMIFFPIDFSNFFYFSFDTFFFFFKSQPFIFQMIYNIIDFFTLISVWFVLGFWNSLHD